MDLEKIALERAKDMDPEVFSEKKWLQKAFENFKA
jgi:hypothetical protein